MATRRSDHLTRRAKAAGYPARSVFKLEEIDAKFRVLRRGASVLDLGAAPGSWTRFAREKIGHGSILVSVDLAPLEVSGATEFVQGDMRSPETAAVLARYAPFDLVMSDAAPATTGNRLVDTGRSEDLVETVYDLASRFLVRGGALVAKIFAGGGERDYLERLRGAFDAGHLFRPKATRNESFEAFLVGTGWNGSSLVESGQSPGEEET